MDHEEIHARTRAQFLRSLHETPGEMSAQRFIVGATVMLTLMDRAGLEECVVALETNTRLWEEVTVALTHSLAVLKEMMDDERRRSTAPLN